MKTGYTSLASVFLLVLLRSSSPQPLTAQTQSSISRGFEVVGHVGGVIQTVSVQGGYAYIGEGAEMAIVDVSTPASPTVVGRTSPLTDIVQDVHVSGNYAYVAAGGAGLRIVDVSDPAHPTEVGFYDAPGNAQDVYLVDGIAYIVDLGGLRVVDVSDPANPVELGSWDGSPLFFTNVYVTGTVAYASLYDFEHPEGLYWGDLCILDVSDPATPTVIARHRLQNHVNDIYVSGNTAYLARSDLGPKPDGLWIVDVSNPAELTEVGFYDTPGSIQAIHVSGDIAYVADYAGGLRVLDVSDPANPTELGHCETQGRAVAVDVLDHRAYVADVSGGLWIADISSLTSPTELGSYNTLELADEVYVSHNTAYVVSRWGQLYLFDISDPANPTEIGFHAAPPGYVNADDIWIRGIDVVNGMAYVAMTVESYPNSPEEVGLWIVDVSDPTNPTHVALYDQLGYARDVFVFDNIAYVADGFDGLRLLDVSDPAHPTEISLYDTWYANAVQVSHGVAYVSDFSGLRIVDVSNPTNPTEVGFYGGTPAQEIHIDYAHISNGIAYLADDNLLRIVDLNNLSSPTEISLYEMSDYIYHIYVGHDIAYLLYDSGFLMLDVSTLTNPTEIASFDISGRIYDLDVSNNMLYLAAGGKGLLVLRAVQYTYLPIVARAYTPPLVHDWQPALSPDNQRVVFVRQQEGGRSDVFMMDADGSNVRNLTQTPHADEDAPIFSPDGSTIAFASNRAGQWDIYLMTLSGTNVMVQPVISHSGTDQVHPSFAPDGQTLAFSSNHEAGNWDLYTAPIAGGTWTRLTSGPDVERFPVFSSDGRTLAYRREVEGDSEIYVMDVISRTARRLTSSPGLDGYPALTPDGSGVVFVSDRSGDLQLYSMNIAGSGVLTITDRPGYRAHTPRLSSDGRTLVYAAAPIPGAYAIYTTTYQSPLEILASRGATDALGLCDWTSSVFAMGWGAAWRSTGDDAYARNIQSWVGSCVTAPYTITHVNDGLLGYAALMAYQFDAQPGYLAFAQQMADYLMNTAQRTSDGTLTHFDDQVWADTLISTVPFLVEMGRVTGDPSYIDEAAMQAVQHAAILQDPATGLYRHAWCESTGEYLSTSYWARGNGWNMIASTQLLDVLPVTQTLRLPIVEIVQNQAQALAALQDSDGLWHTVVNRPDFYLESSGSAGIAYGLNCGVQKGWLPSDLETNAQAARLGLWRKVSADGTLTDVSAPTWPMPEEDYNARPHDTIQLYGQGMGLLALSSCLR